MNRSTELLRSRSCKALGFLPLQACLLAAFALRAWLLGNQNVWWDEGLAIWAVRQSLVRMTLWTASDVHPPLYFWLLQASVRFGGESELSARFLSLFCGTLTVAVLYALGKTLLGRRIAFWGALLLAFARFHVWWSQEMRMYIVATLWGVLSLYALVRWLQNEHLLPPGPGGQPARRSAHVVLWYVLASAAGMYTLYLFIAIILIENGFFFGISLARRRFVRPDLLRRWVASQLAILALFLPWIVLAVTRMRSWSVTAPFDFTVFLQLYGTLLTLGISTYIERYTWLVLPFFVLIALALVWVWRRNTARPDSPEPLTTDRFTAFLLSLFLIVPPALVYALTRPRSLFYAPRVEARYLVLFAPAFYLLLAWCLTVLADRARWLGIAAAVFVSGVFLWALPGHYTGRYLRDEHQTMVRIIAAYAEPDDAVLLVSGSRYPVFGYYYGRLPAGAARPVVYELPQHVQSIHSDNVEAEVAPLAAAHRRLWLAQVNAPMNDPEGLVSQWLDRRLAKVLSFGFAYNALTLYAPVGTVAQVHPENLKPQEDLGEAMGGGAVLLGYDLPTFEFRPGDTVRLALYYSAPTDSSVLVRMLDEPGRALEERDIILPASPMGRVQLDFQVYARTPPGPYHFRVKGSDGEANNQASFGGLRVAATRPPETNEKPRVALTAFLEDGIEFLGFTFCASDGSPVTTIHAGESLTLDLFWRANHKASRSYTVFSHLVGQAYNPATTGPVWAGHDSQPLSGGYPTSQWFVDEVVVDRHVLLVDGQAPAGDYELEVGMYLLETMKRLQTVDAQGNPKDNRIVLGRFPLVRQ
jgi:4-amino-4-deoxy-L-arabinose transferase-like glycosyltransferase